MFIPDKPRPIDFYKEDAGSAAAAASDMIIEVTADDDLPSPLHNHHFDQIHPQQQQMILEDSSGEDHEAKAPKKRPETWVQDEIRNLIALRRDINGLFNTSKSNKHLWEKISAKMKDKGFDRSPTMCKDKWRNLLKDFKWGSAKMSYYKEIEDILRKRNKKAAQYKSPTPPAKVDSYMPFSDKDFDDAGIYFETAEATARPALNQESRLNHDDHPLAITAADAVEAAAGVPPWNWMEAPENGADNQSYGGKVITVKYVEYTRRIGIDGTADAIKEAIRSAFRLRTKRSFWLEDEEQVIRSLDRDMPIGNYTLHLDEGLVIKVCHYDESNQLPVHTEEKIFYTEDDYRDFLARRGWTCLREFDGYRNIDNMDDLQPGALYRGLR